MRHLPAAAALLAMCSAAAAGAQEPPRVTRNADGYVLTARAGDGPEMYTRQLPSAAVVLQHFAREESQIPRGGSGGTELVHLVLGYAAAFPAPTVDSIVSGLAELAERPSGTELLRRSAIVHLGFAANRAEPAQARKATASLLSMYGRVSAALRTQVVNQLGRTRERGAVIPLLRSIAVQPPERQDYPGASADAVFALARLGREGPAVLRELHARRLVQNPEAAFVLGALAADDYTSIDPTQRP